MNEHQPSKRCAYLKSCYLAEAANCYGYKTDCPLYLVSNDEEISEVFFNKAVDELINKTKLRYEDFPTRKKSGADS